MEGGDPFLSPLEAPKARSGKGFRLVRRPHLVWRDKSQKKKKSYDIKAIDAMLTSCSLLLMIVFNRNR